jgi:predicted GNAT superfamily acetyltransferase
MENYQNKYIVQILDKPEQMAAVEEMQRIVFKTNETNIVPAHVLLTYAHNGGVVIGAYYSNDPDSKLDTSKKNSFEERLQEPQLVGYVYGFPGLYRTPDGLELKHCSHQKGVHPEHRNRGIAFELKKAQWMMVQLQGIGCITWTYDPLLSPNANVNINKHGAVCNTYLRDVYGHSKDKLNPGIPTDRFRVDFWTDSERVKKRMNKDVHGKLDLDQLLSRGAEIINPTCINSNGLPCADFDQSERMTQDFFYRSDDPSQILVEIPYSFIELRTKDIALALNWRLLTRSIFEFYFQKGYIVVDFIVYKDPQPRSFYVLSNKSDIL